MSNSETENSSLGQTEDSHFFPIIPTQAQPNSHRVS